MKNYIIISLVLLSGGWFSCTKDLNRVPLNSLTSSDVYSTAAGYKEVLAKAYGSYALPSSIGTGASDINIAGISDPATTDFLRGFWNAQELTTDEALNAWNDAYLNPLHALNFTSNNIYDEALYDRCLFQVTVCNEFIRESTDPLLASRGITGTDAVNVRQYRAEARFLRAFDYWVLMDLYGNPAMVTENDPVGAFLPPQIQRADLFTFVESELKSIDSSLVAPHQNEYGRADQAAEWALLARMYLNADTYLGAGNDHYTDAITYASKVINAGYSLMPTYQNLFLADNNLNNPEVILSINYDGVQSQNYGGTTYLVNASLSAAQVPTNFGVPNGGWTGNRTTPNLPTLFPDYSGATDHRALFNSTGATLDVAAVTTFTDGLAVVKWSNLTSTGTAAPSANGVLCSTDFPLFRLGEMYLVYAEAVLRGGSGGTMTQALTYFNDLRMRAYGNTTANVSSIALPDILNERGRELYWEGFRRTDLIRYGQFTQSTYLWPWKGNVAGGTGVDAHFALFPIPETELLANPHMVQNPGY